jgi:complexin-1/2
MPQEEPNPLMRKKKTPEELAREAEAEEEDEFTSKKGSGRTPHNTSSHPASGDSPGIGRTGLRFPWFHTYCIGADMIRSFTRPENFTARYIRSHVWIYCAIFYRKAGFYRL